FFCAGASALLHPAKSRSAARANINALNFAVEEERSIKTEASDATDRTRLRLSNRDIARNALAALFHPKSRRNSLQAGLLARPKWQMDAAFSRCLGAMAYKASFKGLTVAVTTQDSHPLPYSPGSLFGVPPEGGTPNKEPGA